MARAMASLAAMESAARQILAGEQTEEWSNAEWRALKASATVRAELMQLRRDNRRLTLALRKAAGYALQSGCTCPAGQLVGHEADCQGMAHVRSAYKLLDQAKAAR